MAIWESALEGLAMKQFWSGKKVFITGHTGFKGAWLGLWLTEMGSLVKGYALPAQETSMYNILALDQLIQSELGDICDETALLASLQAQQPEIVFHLAAQSLVRESYQRPLDTYRVNVMGTANLLEAVRQVPSVKVVVVITTDKCYENQEWIWPYRENETLGGHDPYSSSKACAELVTSAYRNSFFDTSKIGIATARAGNVIGGGDFSKDRLIPDFVRAILANQPISLRYPQAIRPWQHVLEPLGGYLKLAEKLWEAPNVFSEAWNFGPHSQDVKTVAEVVDLLVRQFGRGSWSQDSGEHPHEAHYLKLDIQKAVHFLEWHPRFDITQALMKVSDWYQSWNAGENMLEFSRFQVLDFMKQQVS